MIKSNQSSYAAIVTLELPGMGQPVTWTITLRPPDEVTLPHGEAKVLGDCTLRELREYGESLESEILASFQEIRLLDLAAGDENRLSIKVLGDDGEALALSDGEIFAHAVLTPVAEDVQERAAIAPARTTDQEADERGQTDEDDAADDAAAAVPESSPEKDIEPHRTTPADIDSKGEEVTSEVQAVESEVEDAPPSEDVAEPAQDSVAPALAPEEAIADTEIEPGPILEVPPRELRIAGLQRPLGHPTPAAADILINEGAFRDAQAHSMTSLDREVAGMLVGPQPEKKPDGRYVVHITDVIIARHTRMHGASVTYTPESWRYVTDVLAERYPGEEAMIVGWYHTHPGFGIFLSGMDLFIHKHFFTQKWHVALVLDPHSRKSGFFCWDRDQTGVHPYEFPWPDWAPTSW